MNCNAQCKLFPVGSVVFFIKRVTSTNNIIADYCISWGVVESHYPSVLCLQLYEPYDPRLIDGIPVKQLSTPTPWKKIPKNWDGKSPLFEVTTDPERVMKDTKSNKPEDILNLIRDGSLVKVSENDHADIHSEASKAKGWRIVRTYDPREPDRFPPDLITINISEVYATFEEAQNVLNDICAEWKRQAALSDYDWSVEQIDKVLDKWSCLCHIDDETKKKYRDWILELDNVEDVVIRMRGKNIEWKYEKNKRWSTIYLPF